MATNKNYNAGVLKVSCIINEFCPIVKELYQEVHLPFNSNTIENAPKYIRDQFEIVPGEMGLFLKPQYVPFNNFLSYDDGITNEVLNQDCIDKYYNDWSTAYSDQSRAKQEYSQFEWMVNPSLFADEPIKFSSYGYLTGLTNPARWGYTGFEFSQMAKYKRGGISDDGKVLYISQQAATPSSTSPIHWSIRKALPLYRGEDFFIEFRRLSKSFDLCNRRKTTSDVTAENYQMDRKWYAIDVNYAPNDLSSLPPNSALVPYQLGPDSQYSRLGTLPDGVADSAKYDLNNQPYYVIVLSPMITSTGKSVQGTQKTTMSSDTWYYCIMIPFNANPVFLKVYKDETGGDVSTSLGSYDLSGSTLLLQDVLRMSVRNHLGKIIITFSGHEDAPWIIEENIQSTQSKNTSKKINFSDTKTPPPLAIVPKSYLTIYGGSIQTAMMFAPILYNVSGSVVNLPVSRKEASLVDDSNMQDPKNLFIFPSGMDMGVKLSIRSSGIDSSALISGSSDWTVKKDFFVSDSYLVTGTDDGDDTTYMDTGDYLREMSSGGEFYPQTIEVTKTDVDLGDPDYVGCDTFHLSVKLKAGSYVFTDSNSGEYTLGCSYTSLNNGEELVMGSKTPILSTIRLYPKAAPSQAWPPSAKDVSGNVMSISDNWSSSDYNKMEHNTTIHFLLNQGLQDSVANSAANYLRTLQNKAFYVNLQVGYQGCNYSNLEGVQPMMVGVCFGGSMTQKAGEEIMQCQCFDYSKILQSTPICNSPFFDGVRDINAVSEILDMAKFRKDKGGPASLIESIKDGMGTKDKWSVHVSTDQGRVSHGRIYALSQGYARLTGGAEWRFANGKYIYDAIHEITKKSGKVMFFDAAGVFHYENFPIDEYIYTDSDPNDIPVQYQFSTSPDKDGQLVFNALTVDIAVTDVFNNIHVLTSTPNGEMIIGDDVNKPSIYDPSSEGFLGFMKTFWQQDGIFGSEEAVASYIKSLTKFYRPPVVYKFETFGIPLRCFDIVAVDNQRLIVVSVSSTVEAKDNKWWMNVEGEWLNGQTI